MKSFRHYGTKLWRRTLLRCGKRDRTSWEIMGKIADSWLPQPHTIHPRPQHRFAVNHSR
jgi:RNA-directed DNA polymerase